MRKGPLITVSGLDGAGKTTQTDYLMEWLESEGLEPVYIWSRIGYTPGMELAKSAVRALPFRVLPPSGDNPTRDAAFRKTSVRRTWIRAGMVDLGILYGITIRSWLLRGRAVVCDRYVWDSFVDLRLAFPQEDAAEWLQWKILLGVCPKPDLSIFLTLPETEARRRAEQKNDPFLLTAEKMAERRRLYEQLYGATDWTFFDSSYSATDVRDQIRQKLTDACLNL